MINTQFNTLVKTLRRDNGGEFISSHFQSLLHSHGIINQRSYPHTQQNKVVECKCRHLLEIARSLMFQASFSSPFRGHAILMAFSIINRLPSSFLSWRTPFENLQNRFPDYILHRVFDCLCYATNTRPHKDRFAPRAIKCIFLGQKAYRLFNLSFHHLFVSRDVIFLKTNFPFQSMSSPPASLPLPTPTLDDSPAVSSSPYSPSIPSTAPLVSLPAAFPPLTHLLTASLASPAVFSPLPSPPAAP